MAAVLDWVGQPLRSAWMINPRSDSTIKGLPGVLLKARVYPPRARPIIIASTVRVVAPLELRVITRVFWLTGL